MQCRLKSGPIFTNTTKITVKVGKDSELLQSLMEGIKLMKPKELAKFEISPEQAYGDEGLKNDKDVI